MSCRCLGQLYVLGLVVQVGEYGSTETNRRDVLTKACVPLDSVAHLSNLGIGQGALAAKHKFSRFGLGKIGDSQGRQANRPGAAPGLGVLDFGLVAVWVGHGPANMYGSILWVNVGPLQSQHFFQA